MKTPHSNQFLLAISCCLAAFTQTSAAPDAAIEIPFDFIHDAIVVQAKINGKGPFNMMLDTGADPSVVDLATAKEIGLPLAANGQPVTSGGTDTNLSYETRLPLVELGGLSAKDVDALALDLSKISATLGKPIHGVLGYSLLKNRIVQIDYPKRVARFYAASPFPKTTPPSNDPKLTILPFRYQDDILVDGVSVNGKNLIANLDTGSDGGFQLTPAAVAELGLEAEINKAQVSHSTGFNGDTENHHGTVGNVTIGGISLDDPAVIFYGKGTGRDNESWGIRIGNAFLKNFVVTIDYQSNVITLQKL